MIGRLYIENFLFIRDVELEFSRGLNVITGETGTGKSMTLSALEFVLGKQGDYPEGTAVEIEVISEGEEFIVRREVRKGRSRFFLNGRGTTKSVVRELLSGRISLQGQNEFVNLLREDFQRKLLDSFGKLENLLEAVSRTYKALKEKERQLKELEEKRRELEEKRDYYLFRIREVEEIGLSAEEYGELLDRAKKLKHLERIKRGVGEALFFLYEGEGSAYEKVSGALKALGRLEEFSDTLAGVAGRLRKIREEILEVYYELKGEDVELSEEEINDINEKLYRVQRLEEKYRKPFPEILKETQKLKEELGRLEDPQKEEELLREVQHLREEYERLSSILSERRREKAGDLERRVEELLSELNLERAKLRVLVEESEPTEAGRDRVRFLFSSYGEDFGEIGERASGGEISRLFLALSLILPPSETYVFDEVDAGISGETSLKLARFLKKLSRRMQVIVVTHSAPLCAAGDRNFKTEKEFIGDIPYVRVRELSSEEKVEEVARLMGIKTEKTLEGARELLSLFSD
ncbi:MAG: DNA repair protein RecN [Aquificae bacterium]|nr:DNA repair protein RecN [Aquificota bacterium]